MNSNPTPCPRCGAEPPPDAPQGLCPRCLAALNFVTETMPPDAVPIPPKPPLTPEELAPHFPQLEILECLGRGGMGVVYKARQKTLNRIVALKLLAPERADDAKFAARFEKEAQALAALNHPNIVTIHDFGQAGGFFFLLMEFVDGVNLRQAMTAGRFTPEQALATVPPICDALQYAHEHGIVHRDIKPENLLLDKAGVLKIADFGIAKMIGAAGDKGGDSLSQPLGTPAYAAPEQKDDTHQVDHRADIYSLGVVLYELLTGELPKDKIEAPSKRVQIDVRLDEVVLRALQTKPELRFATAAEFRTRLAGVVAAPSAKTAGAAAKALQWLRTPMGLVAAAAAVVVMTLFMLRQNVSQAATERARSRVLITGEQNETDASVDVRWTVKAQRPGVLAMSHANGRQSSPLQWNPRGQDHEVQVQVQMNRLKDEQIRIHTQIGSSAETKELTGNFAQLREEILLSRIVSTTTEMGAGVVVCRLLGQPLTLELAATSSAATPAEQFRSSIINFGLLAGLQLAVLGGLVWVIRLLFKQQRRGCAVILILLLAVILLLLIPGWVWFFSSTGSSQKPAPASHQKSPTTSGMRLQEEVFKLQHEEASLSQTLGRNHPQMKAVRGGIVRLQQKLEQERQDSAATSLEVEVLHNANLLE